MTLCRRTNKSTQGDDKLLNERKESERIGGWLVCVKRAHRQKAQADGAKIRVIATPARGRPPQGGGSPSRPLPAAGRGGGDLGAAAIAARLWRHESRRRRSVAGVWCSRARAFCPETVRVSALLPRARQGHLNQSPARPTVGPTPKMQGPLLAAALLLVIAHLCTLAHAQGMQFDAHLTFIFVIYANSTHCNVILICGKIGEIYCKGFSSVWFKNV